MSMKLAPDHRSQRRLVRRWKRRLWIAAPFLSLPLLLGMLVLSVDLIEYRPEEPPPRPGVRPTPAAAEPEPAADFDRRSVSTASVTPPERIPVARPARISASALDLELDLQLPELELSPAPAPTPARP